MKKLGKCKVFEWFLLENNENGTVRHSHALVSVLEPKKRRLSSPKVFSFCFFDGFLMKMIMKMKNK